MFQLLRYSKLDFPLLLCVLFASAIDFSGSQRPDEIVSGKLLPLVINTWPFTSATKAAWEALNESGSALDAVEKGCKRCEVEQCDGTVGYGGSPDERGHTTLDAMIMDGVTHDVGAVGCLKHTRNAISMARSVMEHTDHTLLVGDDAFSFASEMGFKKQSLETKKSRQIWEDWIKNKCQPNYWKNVQPDPKTKCGPYTPKMRSNKLKIAFQEREDVGHDTIGMIAIDKNGNIAAGTSTNGLSHKIPGRVGDSPIVGAGAYVDNDVGAAAATGDGDVMMRFLPSFHAVLNLRNGMDPKKAALDALKTIVKYYPSFNGALIVASKNGDIGAAAHGFEYFKYSVINPRTGKVVVISVNPTKFD